MKSATATILLSSVFAAILATASAAAFPQPATAYDFSKLKRERLGRGVVAFRSGEREAVVSWRYRMEDPTDYRFWTFLQDPPYRISLATENVGYNQPPQPGFYFGPDLKGYGIVFRGMKLP